MDERQNALEIVNAALVPLRRIDELYYTATGIEQQTAAEQTAYKKKKKSSWVIAAIAAIALWRVLAIIMVSKSPGVLGLVFSCILTVVTFFVVKKITAADKSKIAVLEKKNAETLQKISDEIEKTANVYSKEINALPRDYRYFFAADFFENALSNGRADNMKEAINLFETHLHQMKLENQNQQLLYMNEQQTRMLAEIEQNTSDAVHAIDRNTAFNVLSYLSR